MGKLVYVSFGTSSFATNTDEIANLATALRTTYSPEYENGYRFLLTSKKSDEVAANLNGAGFDVVVHPVALDFRGRPLQDESKAILLRPDQEAGLEEAMRFVFGSNLGKEKSLHKVLSEA